MTQEFLKRWLIGDLSLVRIVRSAALIYGIFTGYVFFRADSMIFLPPDSSYSDTDEILKLTTAGDRPRTHHHPRHRGLRHSLLAWGTAI